MARRSVERGYNSRTRQCYSCGVRIVLSDREPTTLAVDALLLPFPDAPGKPKLPLRKHLSSDAETLAPRLPESCGWVGTRRSRAPRALLARGPAQHDVSQLLGGACGSPDDETVRVTARRDRLGLGAKIERACRGPGCRRVALHTGADLDLALDLLEGMALRAYTFDEFSERDPGLRQVTWTVAKGDKSEAKRRLALLQAKLEGMRLARTLADLPPNAGTPEQIADRVATRAEAVGLHVDALGRSEIEELEMGLFCAIAKGSHREPRLLVLEHRPAAVEEGARPEVALVGKGVTLDAGGYNLKSIGMHEMNYDKAGAAAVIGAMIAIARAQLPVHVVAACPLAENALGPEAIRPGAIVRAYDGRSVYIENVDAEGRLLMADTLAWLCEREPRRVIDVATLTGAAHTALGEPFAALFANDDELRDALLAAGRRADERLWPMPIDDLHDRELAHARADLRNVGAPAGGASAAAAFLRYFVSGAWAHIDLAGKEVAAFERDYMGAGASGFGTRLLFEYVRALGERRG